MNTGSRTMLIADASIDMPMQTSEAPSARRIPTHTEFIIRKKDMIRNGRVYSMHASTFCP